MGVVRIRLPDPLHGKVRELAVLDGVSVNQLITTAVAEKVAALSAEAPPVEPGARGEQATFVRVLARVRGRAPTTEDEHPRAPRT